MTRALQCNLTQQNLFDGSVINRLIRSLPESVQLFNFWKNYNYFLCELFEFILQIISDIFHGSYTHIGEEQTLSASTFLSFLLDLQKDSSFGNDVRAMSNFIAEFVQDPQRDIQESYLTIFEVSIYKILLIPMHQQHIYDQFMLRGLDSFFISFP